MADKVRIVLVGGAFRHDAGQLLGWGGRGVHQPKTITQQLLQTTTYFFNSVHVHKKQ
jgi:hypothetical protein